MDLVTLALAKKYTDDEMEACGNVTIDDNTPSTGKTYSSEKVEELIGSVSGGATFEKDIVSRHLHIADDMEITDISSDDTVYLYANENLAVMEDKAEATSKGVTTKIEDGLIYINGIATGSAHIYPTFVLPSWVKGNSVCTILEVVSGTKTGTITFKLPLTYMSSGVEKQATANTNATSLNSVAVKNVNTQTVDISIPADAGGTNLVLKLYLALVTSERKKIASERPVGSREVVSGSISGKNGYLITDSVFSAHVKRSKEMSPLFGKKMVICGDSVAFGAQGNPFGFTIAENEGMSYENHAQSGATISTYTSEKNVALQASELTGDYDYIVCDGGYNDKAHSVSLGELSSGFNDTLDASTVLGATESLCKTLINNYPNAKKLFVLIHKVASSSFVVDANQQTYFDAIITALKKWNMPYIDLREYPLCAYNETYANTYFNPSDFSSNGGVHPNNAGYALGYIDQITAKMKTI